MVHIKIRENNLTKQEIRKMEKKFKKCEKNKVPFITSEDVTIEFLYP